MREVFQETDLEDPYEVTAWGELDFEADEVTELIEMEVSRVDSSTPRLSFMPSLFRAL